MCSQLVILPFAVPAAAGKVLIVVFAPVITILQKDVELLVRRASFQYREDQQPVDAYDLIRDELALPALLQRWADKAASKDHLGLGWSQRAPPMVMLPNSSRNCWINVSFNVLASSVEQACFDFDVLQHIEEHAAGKALMEFLRAARDSSSEPFTWEQHRDDFCSSAISSNADPRLKVSQGGAGEILHFWEFLSELSGGRLNPLMFSELVYHGTCRKCDVEMSATRQRLYIMANKNAFRETAMPFLEAVLENYVPHAYFNNRTKGFPCHECKCIIQPTNPIIKLPSKLLIVECHKIKPSEFAQFQGSLEKQRLDNKGHCSPWWRLFAVVFHKNNVGWKVGHATCAVLGRDDKCAPTPTSPANLCINLCMIVCPCGGVLMFASCSVF